MIRKTPKPPIYSVGVVETHAHDSPSLFSHSFTFVSVFLPGPITSVKSQ